MKFCTGADGHSVISNIKKDFQKSNDVIDNDVIMLRHLWFCRNTYMEYPYVSYIYGRIIVKFCTWVAHDDHFLRTKQNCEISADVIDSDVIILKFERFLRKALDFTEGSISLVCESNVGKIGRVTN